MSRPRLSPSLALAALALFFALGGSALAVGDRVFGGSAATVAQKRCADGAVKGIAVVKDLNPPGQFTRDPKYFSRRFNCKGRGVEIRKVTTGVFDLRFPGIAVQSAIAGSLMPDGAGASVVPQPDGSFRVTPRWIKTESNYLVAVDHPFALIVF